MIRSLMVVRLHSMIQGHRRFLATRKFDGRLEGRPAPITQLTCKYRAQCNFITSWRTVYCRVYYIARGSA